jgi:peptidyl-prolyl cis-trans isomerase B (cyclophilin B)
VKRILALFSLIWAGASALAVPLGQERIVFRTDLGDIVVALYPTVAPKTAKQFRRLALAGIYDSSHFPRVHPGFVIQISDERGRDRPLNATQKQVIERIPLETDRTVIHDVGRLSMAHWAEDENGAEVSFSILLGKAPHLDGHYTVFGEVVQGLDVLLEIIKVPRKDTTPLDRIGVSRAFVADSEAELAQILEDGKKLPKRLLASSSDSIPQIAAMALALVLSVGLLVSALGGRIAPQKLMSLHLLTSLIALFALFILLAPQAKTHPYLGLGLLTATFLIFRLFSQFEVGGK